MRLHSIILRDASSCSKWEQRPKIGYAESERPLNIKSQVGCLHQIRLSLRAQKTAEKAETVRVMGMEDTKETVF